MENWVAIVPVQGWVDQWAGFLSRLPGELAIALSVLSVVLAIMSRQWAVVTGCIILILSAFLVFISPSNVAAILGTALYIGSLVMAVSAILARRRAKNSEVDLATLRSQLNDLLESEQRRLLRDIRSSSKERVSNVLKSKRPKDRTTETRPEPENSDV
jgi:hypothetical protein